MFKNNFIEFKDKTRIEKQKIVKDKIKNIQKMKKIYRDNKNKRCFYISYFALIK